MPDKNVHVVIWLIGLSGAGKSTIADALLTRMRQMGKSVARLDGDDLRAGLNADLGFSPEARSENLRRAAHVALLLAKQGHVVLCSFITPLNEDRRKIREIVGPGFREVHVSTSLAECERRDPKGLYKRARAGQIVEFTGITSPFEAPEGADLVLDSERLSVEESVNRLLALIDEITGKP